MLGGELGVGGVTCAYILNSKNPTSCISGIEENGKCEAHVMPHKVQCKIFTSFCGSGVIFQKRVPIHS